MGKTTHGISFASGESEHHGLDKLIDTLQEDGYVDCFVTQDVIDEMDYSEDMHIVIDTIYKEVDTNEAK